MRIRPESAPKSVVVRGVDDGQQACLLTELDGCPLPRTFRHR